MKTTIEVVNCVCTPAIDKNQNRFDKLALTTKGGQEIRSTSYGFPGCVLGDPQSYLGTWEEVQLEKGDKHWLQVFKTRARRPAEQADFQQPPLPQRTPPRPEAALTLEDLVQNNVYVAFLYAEQLSALNEKFGPEIQFTGEDVRSFTIGTNIEASKRNLLRTDLTMPTVARTAIADRPVHNLRPGHPLEFESDITDEDIPF